MNLPGTAARAARAPQVVVFATVRRRQRRAARLLRLRRVLFLAVAYDFGRLPDRGRRPLRHPDGRALP